LNSYFIVGVVESSVLSESDEAHDFAEDCQEFCILIEL